MKLYNKYYAHNKAFGISKKEWEISGYENFLSLLMYVGVNTKKNLSVLVRYFRYQEHVKGSFLLKENQFPLKLYYIISGSVRIYSTGNNIEITQFLLGAGNFVSSVKFFCKGSSEIYIETCSKCRVLVIDAADLLFHARNGWGNEIMTLQHVLLSESKAFSDQILDIRKLPESERISKLITICPDIFQQFSAKHIAGFLELRQSTYNRLRSVIN